MQEFTSLDPKHLRLSIRIFAVFTLVYLCTWAGHYTTGDGQAKLAWAKVLIGLNPGIHPDRNGVYSKYGIGHSLLSIPTLAASHLIQKTTGIHTEAAFYTLLFVLNGGLVLGLIGFYLAHYYSPRQVWMTAWIIALATTWWPYTKLDFSEPFVLTAILLGFLLIRFGKPLAGLTIAGLSMTIRPDSPVILLPLVLWFLWGNRNIKSVIKVGLAFAPSIALILFSNYLRYHAFSDRGYADQQFSNPIFTGLYGILISSGKGVFLFSPPLLLGFLGWKRFASRRETVADAWLFLGIFAAQVLFYAKYWIWSSDDAWGMRYALPGIILMCIPIITILERRRLVIPIFAVGVFIQLLAVTVGGLDFIELLRAKAPHRETVFFDGSDRIDFADMWFNPNYSPLYGNWILLRYALHLPPPPSQNHDEFFVGTRLYDAIAPQDWAAAAHWDFIWNRSRAAGTVSPGR